ncbi:MAG: tRNA lysidine(34) synthetase TilS [Deltaproteobacteria bacterium]|nr:tRNA lysidine(34) synthetase TilS [Deltaproteobacteria bacterium]
MPRPLTLPRPLYDPGLAETLPDFVEACSRAAGLLAPGDRVLVAVSGGPDSTALLHLLCRLRDRLDLRLGVAHFDHGLRGQDSRDDAAFVEDLARRLHLPFHPGRGDVRAEAAHRRISPQMAARRLRFQFFGETCRAHGYAKLALGHTADDQVELFFLRLLRGAGPQGLKGMWPRTADGLIRPCLGVGKAVLLAWLEREGLPYRRDASNLDRRYLRNRVRLELLPQLTAAYHPRLPAAVWRLMDLLQEDERLLARETERALTGVVREVTQDFFTLHLPALFSLPPALQTRILKGAAERFTEDQGLTWAQVTGLLALARGRRRGGEMPVGRGRAGRAGDRLHFWTPLPPPPSLAVPLEPADAGELTLPPGWRLSWRTVEAGRRISPKEPGVAVLDRDALTLPLLARHYRAGDRFRREGAPGAGKLQDVFTDLKVPRWLRGHLPLLESGGAVVWVLGLGVARPFKTTPASRSVLEISLEPLTPETRRVLHTLQAWLQGKS